MRVRSSGAVLVGFLLPFLFPAAASGLAQSRPPAAPKREVADTYFGKVLTDPYRWMERPTSQNPQFLSWLRRQNAHTRDVLDRLPDRPTLQARLSELADITTTVPQVFLADRRWFYLKLRPGEQTPKLYVRDVATARERMLLDPDTLPGRENSHWAIDYVVPAPDGRLVVYGASLGGSERTTLYVLDAITGRRLPDSISRVQFGAVAWAADGRSFAYNRLNAASDTNPALRYRNSAAFRHVIGRPVAGDELLLARDSTPSVPLEPDDFPTVIPVEGSAYVYSVVFHGVRREITLYAARASDLRGPTTPWRKLADVEDGVVAADFHGNDVYLLTHEGAPRFNVLRIRADALDLGAAEVVVPEGPSVLTGLAVAKDGLYVQELEGGLGRVRRVPFGRSVAGTPIPLPNEGAIASIAADRRQPGVLFPLESWVRSRLWYHYAPAHGQPRNTGVLESAPVDVSGYVSIEAEVPSHDGIMVPLSIVYRKDLARDGSSPALLDGYGAYGVTEDPYFSSTRLAWLERGGVYAVAHVRGGGEHGKAWHLAGKGATKPNTWKDFIACAEYLVREGYTSPKRLAGTGTSAGGILIGRAITDRPDLFRAAVPRVGVMNALRTEHEPGGPANIPEFGTTATEEGFRGLEEMDAVGHVKPGVGYPAVLLTAGVNDSRVEAWQPAKMAAVLQERSSSGHPVLLLVGFDAGHGMGLTKAQRVEEMADIYGFLLWQLGISAPRAPP
ncbi:MAG: S9 family peptidase [Gemmatimonadales bacterium]|nr:S9 family peptidase [Gemmatimonadales bacterium]